MRMETEAASERRVAHSSWEAYQYNQSFAVLLRKIPLSSHSMVDCVATQSTFWSYEFVLVS